MKPLAKAIGLLPTIIAILFLIALIFGLKLGENGALFSSEKGPGSQHANLFISLICAIIIGAFMQRSKFCSVGAISKIFERDFSMFYGIVSIVLFASITNLVLDQYKFGFEAQLFCFRHGSWSCYKSQLRACKLRCWHHTFCSLCCSNPYIYAIYVEFFTKKFN
ncbi:hypothetical protein MTT09_09150 [Campylobacter concisus]|uniref:hypothetical protein n=1 Tax=Campylobacter concisus TaxID=199 RepID=UPI003D1F7989